MPTIKAVTNCPWCGVLFVASMARTYDANKGAGKWCPVCKGALDTTSVTQESESMGLTNSLKVARDTSVAEDIVTGDTTGDVFCANISFGP